MKLIGELRRRCYTIGCNDLRGRNTMSKRALILSAGLLIAVSSGVAVAVAFNQPVEFFKGHTHSELGDTIGGPQHSGGTDRYGCHNGSVPYHCH